MRTHVLYCDGASRGNPGPASVGAILYDPDGETVCEISEQIGETTNNVAEYAAVIMGLKAALELDVEAISVRLDSQLLVRQLEGRYKVKAAHLKPLHREAATLLADFEDVELVHVPREQNAVADALANAALDE